MLQQILQDMYVDPDLLAELDEEQKQILFCKIRQEQVRRWKDKEAELDAERKIKGVSLVREAKIKFLEGRDGKPWVWVMGDHSNDKTIDQILTEEAQVQARKQAEEESNLLSKQNEEALMRLREAEMQLQFVNVNSGNGAKTASSDVVQMRRPVNNRVTRKDEIENIKKIRSSEIFESIECEREKTHKQAEDEGKELFELWRKQEKGAKEAEEARRLVAKKVREDNARAIRKMRTESQIFGVLGSSFNVPTACPPGRSARPATKQDVMKWYKELEEPRGVGVNATTKQRLDYFYGLISREEAEEHLSPSKAGTYLIRISDRIWGYALSYRTPDGCKHYLIDASDGRYRFFGGNQIVHSTLDDLVEHHKVNPFSIVGKELLVSPPVSSTPPASSTHQPIDTTGIPQPSLDEIDEISHL